MKWSEIKALSDIELKELAKQKGRKGNASSDAKLAQKFLNERAGGSYRGEYVGRLYGSKYFGSVE